MQTDESSTKVYPVNKRLNKFRRYSAFTLAEVLITLAIIGIVSAMIIPTLINNIQDQVYKVAYKKAFSVASQVWVRAVNDDKIVYRSGWLDATAKVTNFKAFKSYFQIIKDCNNSNNSECWASGEGYWGSNTLPASDALAFTDASGMSWSLADNTSETGNDLMVDTNGPKKPNKYGQDRFSFMPATHGEGDSALTTAGIPGKIIQWMPDYTSYNATFCLSGDTHPCLYQSWLLD